MDSTQHYALKHNAGAHNCQVPVMNSPQGQISRPKRNCLPDKTLRTNVILLPPWRKSNILSLNQISYHYHYHFIIQGQGSAEAGLKGAPVGDAGLSAVASAGRIDDQRLARNVGLDQAIIGYPFTAKDRNFPFLILILLLILIPDRALTKEIPGFLAMKRSR